MLVDVLQSRNSFILQTSVRLSMNYTLLTTERNGAKLEFENFTYTKKCKNENTQITTWRCTDRRCKGTGKTIEGSFEFLLTNPLYHEANPAKKELVELISLQAVKEFPKNARYQENALRIKNILESYQNNRIEVSLNGLSNNFDFV